MTLILIDANVLLRLSDPTPVQHPVAAAALSALRTRGHTPRIIPQSVSEFWEVATHRRSG
jgi:hypothetical protein